MNLGNLLKNRLVADKTSELAKQLGASSVRELTDEEINEVAGGGGEVRTMGGQL